MFVCLFLPIYEGIAAVLAMQYALFPFFLSLQAGFQQSILTVVGLPLMTVALHIAARLCVYPLIRETAPNTQSQPPGQHQSQQLAAVRPFPMANALQRPQDDRLQSENRDRSSLPAEQVTPSLPPLNLQPLTQQTTPVRAEQYQPLVEAASPSQTVVAVTTGAALVAATNGAPDDRQRLRGWSLTFVLLIVLAVGNRVLVTGQDSLQTQCLTALLVGVVETISRATIVFRDGIGHRILFCRCVSQSAWPASNSLLSFAGSLRAATSRMRARCTLSAKASWQAPLLNM